MARRTKFDAVSDAKKARAEAEERLKTALAELTGEIGDRLQQLFGAEEAHHALIALEQGLKSTKKAERLAALTSSLRSLSKGAAAPASPSQDPEEPTSSSS